MTENTPDSQASGFTISRMEDLPDFVNLLNRTSDKIAVPSIKLDENKKPKSFIEIKPYGSSQLHKTKLKDYWIDTYVQKEFIAIEPVHPLFDIQNDTARRIGISPKDDQPMLVIPAFGAQRISKDLLNRYDYLPWRRRNLITVEKVLTAEFATPWYVNFYLYGWVGLLFIGFFLVLGGGDAEQNLIRPVFVQYYFVAVFVWLLAGLLGFVTARQKEGELGRFLNLFALILSAGLPVGAVMYFYGDVAPLSASDFLSIAMLGRFLQFFLILLATLLPGLMYFQFERQRVSAIRDRFFREIMQLNPNVVTREDARISYGGLVDEISGIVGATSRQYALLSFGLPILLSTWMIAMGWLISLDPFGKTGEAAIEEIYIYLAPASTAFSFAFLGAYFFSLNLVFRRYARGDLTPKAYNHITVRIISALIVVWVLNLVPFLNALTPAYLMILAFLVGMFPESGVAFIQDLARKKFLGTLFPSLQEKHPITDLEGINLYDRVRLLEEGVESVENLVHYNPIELLLRTRMPLPRLVDLVDQAILYLYVRGENEEAKTHQASLRILRAYGVRTATDLVRLDDSFSGRDGPNPRKDEYSALFMGLLKSEKGNDLPRLDSILRAIRKNTWINYLMHWRETSEARDKVYVLEDFYRFMA